MNSYIPEFVGMTREQQIITKKINCLGKELLEEKDPKKRDVINNHIKILYLDFVETLLIELEAYASGDK